MVRSDSHSSGDVRVTFVGGIVMPVWTLATLAVVLQASELVLEIVAVLLLQLAP